MFDKKLLKKLDLTVIIIVVLLFIIGITVIASATHVHETHDFSVVKKQAIWFVTGIIAILIIISIDYHTFGSIVSYMYLFGLAMLVAVLVFGSRINGAKSWFMIAGMGIQPAEIVKIIVILSFAKHVERIREKSEDAINRITSIIPLILHMAIPIALIMKQPDWGTAAVFIGIMFTIVFAADISYKYIVGAFISVSAILPILFFSPLMKEYQRQRFLVFINPALDPLGSGYHVIQSKIAVGSGQIFGRGLFNGTQTQLGFLPEQQTDFIFSVIGEELGFLWSVIVVVLFSMLILRLIYLATQARDEYGSYIIIGVAAMFFFHMLVNIGMTIGVVPVTGIPLPFISYGGSSLLTNMMAIGVVLNVAMRRQIIKF